MRAEIAERESKMKELTSTGDGPESSTTNDLKAAKRPRMRSQSSSIVLSKPV